MNWILYQWFFIFDGMRGYLSKNSLSTQTDLVATALHIFIMSYVLATILNEDINDVFQLFIVDGEKLKNQPAAVMHNVQRFLHIEPHYEYNDLLR